VLDAGNVIVVLSVPARVSVLLADKVLPLVTVRVPVLLVIVSPLTLVAVAAPIFGVVRLGDVAKTKEPDPVSSVTAAAKLADDGVPNQVATPDPRDVRPVPP
jgi:hypothetical protein